MIFLSSSVCQESTELLKRAHEVAAAARAACDVLRGAPRSSRDDPEFMDTFYKSSRLHFIGNTSYAGCFLCRMSSQQFGHISLFKFKIALLLRSGTNLLRAELQKKDVTKNSSVCFGVVRSGTWKARIEGLAQQVASECNAPSPTRLGKGERTIIHIDMDCFFAAVASATR